MNLQNLQLSGIITRKAMKSALRALHIGITEIEVANIVRNTFEFFTATEAFNTLVAFGDNTSNIHNTPTNRELRKGDVVMIDCGALIRGQATDMTRTTKFKGKRNLKFLKIFRLVSSYKKLAEKVFESRGGSADMEKDFKCFLEAFMYSHKHLLGHIIAGDKVHGGRLSEITRDKDVVFTIEPGIYVKDFGVRIEDTYAFFNRNLIKIT